MGKRWLDDVFGLRRGTILIAFVLIVSSLWLFGYIRAMNISFDGVIENVSYDYPQHVPTITIKGVDYNLGNLNWNNNTEDIAVGDSAIKRKGTTSFILIKKKDILHSK